VRLSAPWLVSPSRQCLRDAVLKPQLLVEPGNGRDPSGRGPLPLQPGRHAGDSLFVGELGAIEHRGPMDRRAHHGAGRVDDEFDEQGQAGRGLAVEGLIG
jgi:hypothetical protein